MSEKNISLPEFKNLMYFPFAVIIASSIIIIFTTNTINTNGLTALLAGYIALLVGLLFVVILNLIFAKAAYIDMFPIIMVIIIVSLLLYYLNIYFDRILSGQVSGYYSSFSLVSLLFLAMQLIIIFNVIYSKTQSQEPNTKLFSDVTFSFLGLLSVINIIIVLTIGVVLHFYSTQG